MAYTYVPPLVTDQPDFNEF